jgi:2-C-methyl-D-erythritol 4-phosphate cytidylyltransferase
LDERHHDAARPMVSVDLIRKSFAAAKKYKAVIPVVPVSDSLRMIAKKSNKIIDRDNIRIVQTPQVFAGKLLLTAYQQKYLKSFTDDASVVEKTKQAIYLIDGEAENIKITRKFDMLIAEALQQEV